MSCYDLADDADFVAKPSFAMSKSIAFAIDNIYGAVFKMPCRSIAHAVVFQICERNFFVRRRNRVACLHALIKHQTVAEGHIPEKSALGRVCAIAVSGLLPEI